MIFDTLAFPWLIYSSKGRLLASGPGSLFDLPPAAGRPSDHDFYATLRQDGWKRDSNGYAIYCRRLKFGDSSFSSDAYIILPGLKVRGISTVSGKTEGLSLVSEPARVVSHLEAVLEADRNILERFDRVTRQNIHEIRVLNTSLYHAAIELSNQSQNEVLGRSSELAGNIVALSQIISARVDFINYLTDESLSEIDFGLVQVYKKFDKMYRCFVPSAIKHNVRFFRSGASYSYTYGPKSLVELIAYLLLDNALKYSPPSRTIIVTITETEKKIEVTVSSTGPRIADDEAEKIFDLDFRGGMAIKSGKGGSGIGLHAVRNLVEQAFSGTIALVRGDHQIDVDGLPYDQVSFIVSFPITT